MPTILIVMWILSTLVTFAITLNFWIKREKTDFEVAGVLFLLCATFGFIVGWLLLGLVIYFLIIQRFDEKP